MTQYALSLRQPWAALIVAGLFILVHLILAWWTGSTVFGLALR